MKFLKQKVVTDIENFEKVYGFDTNEVQHNGALFPNNMRCLLIGQSGCGKTNTLIALLLKEWGTTLRNVYIYTQTLEQKKYQLLDNVIKLIPELSMTVFSSESPIVPEDCEKFSTIIFDDIYGSGEKNHDIVRQFFSRGRHRALNCYYIGQSYCKIPRHLIRDNANFIILFKNDELSRKHIFEEHVNVDMDFKTFSKMCQEIWEHDYDFLVIDTTREKDNGKYRKGFDNFVIDI